MILALALAQATAIEARPATLRECAVNFVAIGLVLDENKAADEDDDTVRQVRDALVAKAVGGDAAERERIEREGRASLASARAQVAGRGGDAIDYEPCFALAMAEAE